MHAPSLPRHGLIVGLACLLGFPVAAAALPPGPPPDLGVIAAPPPAWVHTRHGDVWLAPGSYCWKVPPPDPSICADFVSGGGPRIVLTRGERVVFHLGVAPRAVVQLRTGADRRGKGGAYFRLAPSLNTVWTVRGRSGHATLSLRAAQGGASYRARFVITSGAANAG